MSAIDFLFHLDSFGEYISRGDWLFNSTYVRGGDTNNNIDINSVSGTLVKNYRNSFFYQCKEGSKEYGYLFDPENPRIYVTSKMKNAIEDKEWRGRDYYTVYYKQVVVLQSMILANGILLNEVIWKDDFDNMFENIETKGE